jgi:hypothetical protein
LRADSALDAAILATDEDLTDVSPEPVQWVTIVDPQPLTSCVLISVSLSDRSDGAPEGNPLLGTLHPRTRRSWHELELSAWPYLRSVALALSGAPVLFRGNLIGIATAAQPAARRIRVTPISTLTSNPRFASITAQYLYHVPTPDNPPAASATGTVQPEIVARYSETYGTEDDTPTPPVPVDQASTSESQRLASGAGSANQTGKSAVADSEGQPPDSEVPPKAIRNPIDDNGYQYDIFLSYTKRGKVQQWIQNHFHPLLLSSLADELSREPRIFFDAAMETGSRWPASLAQALLRSKMMVAIWSPSYFMSTWCVAQLESMQDREQRLSPDKSARLNPSLIYPIVYSGPQNFPQYAQRRQARDLRQWANPSQQFEETSGYRDFRREMRDIAAEIGRMLTRVPAWEQDWPIHRPDRIDNQ